MTRNSLLDLMVSKQNFCISKCKCMTTHCVVAKLEAGLQATIKRLHAAKLAEDEFVEKCSHCVVNSVNRSIYDYD